jgi:hypothetical protein
MKAETYAAINDRPLEAVVNDIKARRLRGYESGGQWYVVPPREGRKQELELESDCLGLYEQSRSLAKEGHWQAAYQSASKGLKIALEYLFTKGD